MDNIYTAVGSDSVSYFIRTDKSIYKYKENIKIDYFSPGYPNGGYITFYNTDTNSESDYIGTKYGAGSFYIAGSYGIFPEGNYNVTLYDGTTQSILDYYNFSVSNETEENIVSPPSDTSVYNPYNGTLTVINDSSVPSVNNTTVNIGELETNISTYNSTGHKTILSEVYTPFLSVLPDKVISFVAMILSMFVVSYIVKGRAT